MISRAQNSINSDSSRTGSVTPAPCGTRQAFADSSPGAGSRASTFVTHGVGGLLLGWN